MNLFAALQTGVADYCHERSVNKPFFSAVPRPSGSVPLLLLAWALFHLIAANAQPQSPQRAAAPEAVRQRYQIQLKIDFDALSYTGSERVRWVNRGNDSTGVLYFHLYSNLRPDGPQPSVDPGVSDAESEQPRIEITDVRSAGDGAPLTYSIDDQGTTLRVSLREQVAS